MEIENSRVISAVVIFVPIMLEEWMQWLHSFVFFNFIKDIINQVELLFLGMPVFRALKGNNSSSETAASIFQECVV